MELLTKQKIELQHNPAILLLDIYPHYNSHVHISIHICIHIYVYMYIYIYPQNYNSKRYMHPLFIVALFTIAKTCRQPKCPLTDEWINIHIYDGILLSHKKEWNNSTCSNMVGPRDHHTKWSKSERERQIPHDITYMCNLQYDTNKLIYETDSQT